MLILEQWIFIFCLFVLDGGATSISLSKYNESINEDQAFTQLMTIEKNTNFVISVDDIPAEVTFIVVQVHAYIYNVSMSYDKNPISKVPGKFITGTNIGLFVETAGLTTAAVYATNENAIEIDGLVAVVAYKNEGKSIFYN